MNFIKSLWERFFPKSDYPTSDTEVIALIKGELEKRGMETDALPQRLYFGYLRAEGHEYMVVFCCNRDFYFVVRMDGTVLVIPEAEICGKLQMSSIALSVDHMQQMEDSFYCWGIFVNDGHFKISRFRKD